MLPEVLGHTVSHLKALVNCNLDLSGQGQSSTFVLCHTFLKKSYSSTYRGKSANLFSSHCMLLIKILNMNRQGEFSTFRYSAGYSSN